MRFEMHLSTYIWDGKNQTHDIESWIIKYNNFHTYSYIFPSCVIVPELAIGACRSLILAMIVPRIVLRLIWYRKTSYILSEIHAGEESQHFEAQLQPLPGKIVKRFEKKTTMKIEGHI